MRILILGGDGMLGHNLLLALRGSHDVGVTLHGPAASYDSLKLFTPQNSFFGVEAASDLQLERVFGIFQPEVVINGIGIIKQRDDVNIPLLSITINALLPHRLYRLCRCCGARLIQLSSDCVFSGREGNYTESSISDAEDLYGRTKYLGEVDEEDSITLRTSIIGLELRRFTSLIEWYLHQRGTIRGFTRAIYSGFTVQEMARIIERVVVDYPQLSGIHQVASTPVSKYELLSRLAGALGRDHPVIVPDDGFICDRSLNGDSFARLTGYTPPDWEVMLQELAHAITLRENKLR